MLEIGMLKECDLNAASLIRDTFIRRTGIRVVHIQ